MITRYECPIAECGWHHDRPEPEMTPADRRGTISASVEALLIREYMDADRIIGAHLATHTPLQWVTELARVNQCADQTEQRAGRAESDLDAVIGAWRSLRDFDEATRRFDAFTGAAGINTDDIKTRLLAVAREMQEAGAR